MVRARSGLVRRNELCKSDDSLPVGIENVATEDDDDYPIALLLGLKLRTEGRQFGEPNPE